MKIKIKMIEKMIKIVYYDIVELLNRLEVFENISKEIQHNEEEL